MSLKKLLKRLDLLNNRSIFFPREEDSNSPLFSSEIQKKLEIIKPDAYYVFNNQPFILFFDLSKETDTKRENIIHKRVWSFDYSPLIFIIKNNEEKVFNAFSYNKETERLKNLEFEDGESKDELFSFWNLQSGATWKWLQEKKYKNSVSKKRVTQKLFDNIKEVRERLVEDNIPEEEANILILRLIFIRYLIDRQVKIDSNFISGDSVREKRKSLSKLIVNSEKLNSFFDYLNERFNGVLFKNTNIKLSNLQATSLALVFDEEAEINTPTLFDNLDDFYFEVFDFSIIPVEIISGIYESLIDKEKKQETSAVYTPPFLVEYILNETVDKHFEGKNISECRIFDPACGSGIFLVQALRRMIDKELEIAGEELNKIEFSERIREIAKNNLFGIDINDQALKVACFSIYVALLDYQEPKDIDKYTFPNLIDENFFEANFFNEDHLFNDVLSKENIKFDFILGNPPWKSNKDPFHTGWLTKHKKVTGRYEIAQSYLLRSKDFMTDYTVSSLIVTSTIFYNISKTTKAFKKEFLTSVCLDTFFDLSPVRRLVFEGEKLKVENGKIKRKRYSNPAVVLIYRLSKRNNYKDNTVKHYSIKSNLFLKHFKSIVIEKNDRKEISQKYFIGNDWMFKIALYGNSMDFLLFKKLSRINLKINDIIDNKDVLLKGSGIKEKPVAGHFPFLIGLPLIENGEVTQYYTTTKHKRILKENDLFLQSGRRLGLFKGEHILFKAQTESESEIIVSYSDKDLVFKHDIFGISSLTDAQTLKVLFAYYSSKLHTYFQFLSNCSWGIATRPAIRLEEYLSFPYKDALDKGKLVSFVNSFLQPLKEHYSKELPMGDPPVLFNILDKINREINKLYEVSEVEEDLIDYVLKVSRYQFQESKQDNVLNFRDQEKDLKKYSEVFLNEFNGIYEDEFLKVEIYPLKHFIAINFRFVKNKPSQNNQLEFIYKNTSEKEVLSILSEQLTIWNITDCKNPENNIYIQKDIKGFEKDSFYIIKPNEYKCWHRAMAWYDVAEIKETIEKAELNQLNRETDVY